MNMIRPALSLFVLLSALTGLAYPVAMTGLARAAFPEQAAGSLVARDGTVVGSALIGQPFSSPEWFWGRPSATAPMPYNAASSAGANQGPTNPALVDAVRSRVEALRTANPDGRDPIPQDLVTTSASGLDPHISPEAARWQIARIAKARNASPQRIRVLVDEHVEPAVLGLLGQPRVNVLKLNMALAAMR